MSDIHHGEPVTAVFVEPIDILGEGLSYMPTLTLLIAKGNQRRSDLAAERCCLACSHSCLLRPEQALCHGGSSMRPTPCLVEENSILPPSFTLMMLASLGPACPLESLTG